MAKKQNQRVKLTKELLKNSLIKLMSKKQIRKITIKEICENAEINRSTFYLYYTDQYQLLNEIEKELIDNCQENLKNIDAYSRNLQYLVALLDYIKERSDIFKILLCNQDSLSFQTAFIETSLLQLQLKLSFNNSDNYSEMVANYIYNYLIMGCLSMIKKWIEADFDMSSKDMANLIFSLSDKATSAGSLINND